LDRDNVRFDERNVATALERADYTSVINARDDPEDREEIVEGYELFLEIEGEALVIASEART